MTRAMAKVSESFTPIQPPQEDIESHRKALATTPGKRAFDDVFPITEGEVREALNHEAKRTRIFSQKKLKRLQIERLEQGTCLKYRLESYTDARSTVETTEACLPGSAFRSEPDTLGFLSNNNLNPWDFEVHPAAMFSDQVSMTEMPGTSRITDCQTCSSEGTMHCFHCRGNGTDKCQFCRGTGMKSGVAHPAVYTHPMIATFPHADTSRGYSSAGTAMRAGPAGNAYGLGTPMHFMSKTGVPPPGIGTHDLCYMCHGRGVSQCGQCKGTGKKVCSKCGGSGAVRSYTKMKVFFKTETSEFFTEAPIPEKFLMSVNGIEIFGEEKPYVIPITSHPTKAINDASRAICADHLQKCLGKSRVIQQRHWILAIPWAEVFYSIGAEKGSFFVYGRERACYFPKYSSKCSIL
ncbi:unnamed protein product, partial [Mesorhabditis spiculigera]